MKHLLTALSGITLMDINTFANPFPDINSTLAIALNIIIAITTLIKLLKAKKKRKDDKYINK
jgi:hypothetical protein